MKLCLMVLCAAAIGAASEPIPAANDSKPTAPIKAPDALAKFFFDVAVGSEYGDEAQVIKKWNRPIRFKVEGTPTPEDLDTLAKVINELNRMSKSIDLGPVGQGEQNNLTLHFIPRNDFANRLDVSEESTNGYVTVWWEPGYRIKKAVILVASDTRQNVRSCVIREELAQSLGIMNESDEHSDSIFHSRTELEQACDADTYSSWDKYVISTLYRKDITAGMDKAAVEAVLGQAGKD